MLVRELRIPLAGFESTSLIDYPNGELCSVIFLGGCNFRCGYCHNPDLLKPPESWDLIENLVPKLNSRKKWIQSLVISGGEPLMHRESLELIKILVNNGFKIKIDTNGSYPSQLEYLINKKLIDYVALDIKTSHDNYEELAFRGAFEKVKTSIELLKSSTNLNYEFRTTLCPKFISNGDLLEISKYIDGKNWYWQQYNPRITLNPSFSNLQPYSKEKILEMRRKVMQEFKGKLFIRGEQINNSC
ncbi:MAG: anaerobic ribonucleoside-triphosphate reductase activating protein [Candidatus Heimdallarchaeota archaeon]|nr:anaerobic ribonucleoside-triphosphate reductase activating protein [Candidatus Heimdallarchaeota archaeon]